MGGGGEGGHSQPLLGAHPAPLEAVRVMEESILPNARPREPAATKSKPQAQPAGCPAALSTDAACSPRGAGAHRESLDGAAVFDASSFPRERLRKRGAGKKSPFTFGNKSKGDEGTKHRKPCPWGFSSQASLWLNNTALLRAKNGQRGHGWLEDGGREGRRWWRWSLPLGRHRPHRRRASSSLVHRRCLFKICI